MRIFTVVMAAAVSFSTTTALADGVGEAEAVTDVASVYGQAGDERPLAVGSKVAIGDVVETGAGSLAELLFDESTRIALSADTSLSIDEFLDDPAKERITFSMLEGSIRVVVGRSGELKYSFQTDWATTAPQGTAFDLTRLPNGGAEVLLLKGQVELCDKNDDCKTVATPCGLLKAEPGQNIEEIEAGNRRVQETSTNFPFQTSESNLSEEFQFPGLGCLGGLADEELSRQAIPTVVILGGAAAVVIIGGVCLFGGCGGGGGSENGTNK